MPSIGGWRAGQMFCSCSSHPAGDSRASERGFGHIGDWRYIAFGEVAHMPDGQAGHWRDAFAAEPTEAAPQLRLFHIFPSARSASLCARWMLLNRLFGSRNGLRRAPRECRSQDGRRWADVARSSCFFGGAATRSMRVPCTHRTWFNCPRTSQEAGVDGGQALEVERLPVAFAADLEHGCQALDADCKPGYGTYTRMYAMVPANSPAAVSLGRHRY